MTTSDSANKLTEITKIIINEDLDFLALKNATENLKILFEKASATDFNNSILEENVFLKTGKAIGPKWAGMCVDDFMRTKRFITGTFKAVKFLLQKNNNKPVHILYAGTGPFATLVMPLITIFKPSEIQFTLLEVNPKSIESLKKTIKSFNAESYVKDIFQTDASIFKVPSPNFIDIVLIECMQHALVREPQVAITYNLVSQLNENVILIPEQISLHIALIDSEKKNNYLLNSKSTERKLDFYTNIKPVFVLDKKIINDNSENIFPKIEVVLPKKTIENSDILAITTEITIYKNKKLTIDDSGLTIPLILSYLKNQRIKGVTSQYIINESPGLETTLIS